MGDDQPAFFSEGERHGGESTPGHREAIADFPNLPSDGNEELPAREVHRDEVVSKPRKEVPAAAVREAEPAAPPARRRTGSSEPRLERIVVGQPLEESTEEASASSAPARKGWWQRKLGGE